MRLRLLLLLPWLLLPTFQAQDDDLPRCLERQHVVSLPRTNNQLFCLERPIDLDEGEQALSAIAFDEQGTLYAARPYQGSVVAFHDSDGDGLPDAMRTLVEGLRLPNGLLWHEGALYIVGDGRIYRYANATLETLVDDLPAGRGFLMSGIAIHDGQLYVGIPAPCDACVPENPLRGTVLRMALDGTQRQVVARGLRYPAALAVHRGALWVTDTARDGLYETPALDELNVIPLDEAAVPHFGFPYCIGLDNRPDLADDFDCGQAVAPAIALPTHSTPRALLPYSDDTFRPLRDVLLVVLGGSARQPEIRGYQFLFIQHMPAGRVLIESILPHDEHAFGQDRVRYDPGTGYRGRGSTLLNRRGAGTWPHAPLSTAISPQGWLFLSVGGGQVYAFRPGDIDPCERRNCDF